MDFIELLNFSALVSKLLLFLTNAVGIELAAWAYVANRYTRPGRAFLIGAACILLWVDLDYFSAQSMIFFPLPEAHSVAVWAFRGLYALLGVFFGAFYIYCLNFPVKNVLDKKRALWENAAVAVWAFFFVLSFTPFVIKGVVMDSVLPLAVWVDPGPLFWTYAAMAVVTLALSFSNLSRNRRFADQENRQRARFVAIGAFIFGIYNLLFNAIAPVFGGVNGYIGFFSVFADFMILVALGAIAYQASKDKLFGIKVILVEIFVGLMGASLVVMPFFVGFLWQQAILIVLFALFCIFGYLLVQGTIKEYREKEILEQRVAERTKELEDAKQNLEEINTILEVRVRARTRELEKLNQTLEEKVVVRTNDLQAKIKDLETFQRITVSRELKMIELKQEIEKLRSALAKVGGEQQKNG